MYIQMFGKKPPKFTKEEMEVKLTKSEEKELDNGKGDKK